VDPDRREFETAEAVRQDMGDDADSVEQSQLSRLEHLKSTIEQRQLSRLERLKKKIRKLQGKDPDIYPLW
jgi:hypothetical protein